MTAEKDLARARSELDSIDDDLSALILKRIKAGHAVVELKREIAVPQFDSEREDSIIDRINRSSPLPRRAIEAVWRAIFRETRGEVQKARDGALSKPETPVKAVKPAIQKPPYRIPSMEEIKNSPRNGYKAISTFSGAGGSCLGYIWAGFDVLWANEFIPAAQEVYRLNHSSILNTSDIRALSGSDILGEIGMGEGELDFMDGSPPCASFSASGKKDKHWGKEKRYSETSQRTDDLFFEFARILKDIQPRAFSAENVPGLVQGPAKGYFKEIMKRLKGCGYRVKAKVIDAQWLGVPQRRKRLIIIGIREDLNALPIHPSPLPYYYTIKDACPWIDSPGRLSREELPGLPTDPPWDAGTFVKHAIYKEWRKVKPGGSSEKYMNLMRSHPDKPCPTVTQMAGNSGAAGVTHPIEPRKFSIPELRRISGFPDNFILKGEYRQQWERLGRAVPPPMSRVIGLSVAKVLKEIDER